MQEHPEKIMYQNNSSFFNRHKETIKTIIYPIYRIYRFFTYDRHKKSENKNFLKNGLETLVAFDRCLTCNGYKYTFAFGTLLGAIREKGFIKHDDDIDTWMWIDDYDENLILVLEASGFKHLWSFSVENDKIGKQDTFIYKGVLVDIFYLYKQDDGESNCTIFANFPDCKNKKDSINKHGGLLPIKCVLPISDTIERVPFLGYKMPLPSNYDVVMKERYGSDYMTPQPKWNKNRIDSRHIYMYDKIGTLIEY